ncbi:hypothetical protein PENTCL1PPCAC_22489, partial [Pristionchus entomophagus]
IRMSSMASDSSFYTGKICLAPMVRAGRTPLRVLSLDYGADLVYTEEIVDQKLLSATRKENHILGTIDYCIEDDVVLRIANERERGKVVLQIGTNNGESAARVAAMVGTDVAAIDINMGCPKSFSIQGGMGAALLTKTEKVKEILSSLVATSQVPVSCKIRVLDDPSSTLALARVIERSGVAAMGVHGRRREERPGDSNREEEIREVVRAVGIPVIANGGSTEMETHDELLAFRERTGASSVMVARAALSNPSIFRKEGIFPMETEIRNFLERACEWDENYTMTKYVVQRMLGGEQEHDPRGRATVQAGSVVEICRAWSMEDKYEECRANRQSKKGNRVVKDEKTGVEYVDVTFPLKRLRAAHSNSPRCALFKLCEEKKTDKPIYDCVCSSLIDSSLGSCYPDSIERQRDSDRRYEAEVRVFNRRFLSRIGQTNKKMAEQVAALAALIALNERGRLDGEWEELCE